MEKAFDSKTTEQKIYNMWETGGYFSPPLETTKKPFTIILPPPNANAALHLGHALYTVEDILVRWHRMMGDPTLWLPGSDHAGFETQVVYEKALVKEGKSRFDFDREALYKNIWDFVHSNKSIMEGQVRRLGFSLDWKREKFTLDPEIVSIVYKTFKKLSDDGLIYRDARLVNYCTKHGTAFSDLEVEHEEKEGFLYHIKFMVEGETDGLVVATARPETIPGDAALAVNPKDKRYKKYVGKHVINPLNGKLLPVIADDYAKKDFGTGIVKITPAHDENDFEVGKRHNLPMIQVIGFDGKLNDAAGEFKGLKVLEAREKIIEYLKSIGAFIKTEPFNHTVSTCYKCGTILEPLPKPQWYVNTKPLAEKAITAVKEGKIKIVPKRFEKIYFNWLTSIRDWNISRQIVWGIRIPAWECKACGDWIITDGIAPEKCKCGSTELVQDVDTFDTWFSSGQWPFATLGYPDNADYKFFYPTSVMETGYDILFFWVARMVMLGLYVTGKVPFETVYLHGMVRDAKGQKMSKSKGNVVNPMELVDKYGADALRMSLVVGTGAGNDQNLSEPKILGYRNFANKVWNMGRFMLMMFEQYEQGGSNVPFFEMSDVVKLKGHNASIMASYKSTVNKVNTYLMKYRLSEAGEEIYQFMWHELADKYIEYVKTLEGADKEVALGVLRHVYLNCLKLLHPFMPFVTEAVWENMPRKYDKPLIVSEWPKFS